MNDKKTDNELIKELERYCIEYQIIKSNENRKELKMDEMDKIDTTKYTNIYVISDIHGCRDEFYEMLKLIDLKETDLLIIIGDIIDRGSEGIVLLQEISTMKNIIVLKGNHESMMVSSMTGDMDMFNDWTKEWNGGKITYKALMNLDKFERNNVLNYADRLPMYKTLDLNGESFLIVHAGLNIVSRMTLKEMLKIQSHNLLWIRKTFLKSKSNHKFKVIFGHTQTYTIDFETNGYPSYYDFKSMDYDEPRIIEEIKNSKIWYNEKGNKIGIDCAVISGGYLACLRLNDMKEFYVKSHIVY